jgi:hypothetical protein
VLQEGGRGREGGVLSGERPGRLVGLGGFAGEESLNHHAPNGGNTLQTVLVRKARVSSAKTPNVSSCGSLFGPHG